MTADPVTKPDPTAEGPTPLEAEGFFEADGDTLIPAEFATSPWGNVLHGRLIGGLTARATEQARADDPDLACGRLTIDMFRSAPLAPMRIEPRTIRSGRRIVVLEITIEQADGPIGQGKAVLLRRTDQPPAPTLRTRKWTAPTPPELGAPRQPRSGTTWTAPWQSWPVGEYPGGGMWMREIHPLVTGEPLTPLVRLALAADLASPAANSAEDGLHFINADYTVNVGREPVGDHIGIQPSGHISEDGVAAAHCIAHDLEGPIAFIATSAVANTLRR